MSVTYAAIERETLRLLSEASNSTVGEVPDGSGGVTDATSVAIVRAVNLVQDWLCRRCVALRGDGSASIPAATQSGLAGEVKFSALTMRQTGFRLWCVSDLWWNGVALRRIDEGVLRLRAPRYSVETADAATHWYERPHDGVFALYPAPRITRNVRVAGLCLPPVIVASSPSASQTSTPSFLDDARLMELLPTGCAIYLAKRLFEDPSVYSRLAHLNKQQGERVRSLYLSLPAAERERFFSTPPDIEGL